MKCFATIATIAAALMLSACHSHKAVSAKSDYANATEQSTAAITDVDTFVNTLVKHNVVVTLKNVEVEYSDTSQPIDVPQRMAKLSVAEVVISDQSEEASQMLAEEHSAVTSEDRTSEAASDEFNEQHDSAQLQPSNTSVIWFSLCGAAALLIGILVYLYRKGIIRL